MGHIAAADDDDYRGLSFDETVRRVKEKVGRKNYSEAKMTDLLTKTVVEGFVWYHVGKPKREYLWSKNNGEFADPLGRIHQKMMGTPSQAMVLNKSADHAADKKGIKRPLSQCHNKEEGEEKKGEKRPTKSMIEKKPITKKSSNVEKKQQEAKKKKSKRFNLAALGLEPPPGLPEDIKRIIEEKGGTDTNLVIMKQLFETDYSKHHDRFSMPLSQMRDGLKFLREDQIQLLETSKFNKKVFVPVNLLQPGFDHKEKRGLALRRWETNCVCYNITTKWHEVVQNNNLKVDDILQIWSFGVGEELWFAMVKVMDCEEARRRESPAGGHRDQQQEENGGGGVASSSHSSGDKAAVEGRAMELLNISPSGDQEDGNGATEKAGGQDQEQQH